MTMTSPLRADVEVARPGKSIAPLLHQWLSFLRKNALQLSSVDVDTGSTPVTSGSLTISDPEINEASRLLVIAAPDDENALEPIVVIHVTCSAGSADVEWEAADPLGAVTGTRTFFYGVSG